MQVHLASGISQAEDEEYTLRRVEALLAGTLALMTGVAQAGPGSAQREPMVRKIADNLQALAGHAQLSEPMRHMLVRLRGHWLPDGGWARPHPTTVDEVLWLRSPQQVQ